MVNFLRNYNVPKQTSEKTGYLNKYKLRENNVTAQFCFCVCMCVVLMEVGGVRLKI